MPPLYPHLSAPSSCLSYSTSVSGECLWCCWTRKRRWDLNIWSSFVWFFSVSPCLCSATKLGCFIYKWLLGRCLMVGGVCWDTSSTAARDAAPPGFNIQDKNVWFRQLFISITVSVANPSQNKTCIFRTRFLEMGIFFFGYEDFWRMK